MPDNLPGGLVSPKTRAPVGTALRGRYGPLGLPFGEAVAADFEYTSGSGSRPAVVCMVAKELASGRVHRLWQDELGAEPPFPVDDDTLFITYFGTAEFTCFLALGWPLPTRVIDLYVEHRHATNGLVMPKGSHTLLGALSRHGISSITSEQKREERELIMGGGPWDAAEREHILTYCQTDVDPLPALLERMLPHILSHPKGLGHALLRGRYVAAAARMEHTGIVKSMKDFYWDIRPKPEYGTIELRVCDTPLTVERAAALAVYLQALCHRLLRREEPAPSEDDYLVYNYNRFQACRFGLEGTVVHPKTYQTVTLREDIRSTLTEIVDSANAVGGAAALEHISNVMYAGTDANYLRRQHELRGSSEGMVDATIALFRSGMS